MSEQYVRNLAELKNLCLEFNMLCVRHEIKERWHVIRNLKVLLSVSDTSLTFEPWLSIERRIMNYVITETFKNGPE